MNVIDLRSLQSFLASSLMSGPSIELNGDLVLDFFIGGAADDL